MMKLAKFVKSNDWPSSAATYPMRFRARVFTMIQTLTRDRGAQLRIFCHPTVLKLNDPVSVSGILLRMRHLDDRRPFLVEAFE